MPYCLDRWDHICPNGHRNTIDKTYLATEPSDSAVAFAISFPDKLPCAGCRYKLTLPTDDSVLHCNISEFEYERIKENKLAESAAYHETAHWSLLPCRNCVLIAEGCGSINGDRVFPISSLRNPKAKSTSDQKWSGSKPFDQRRRDISLRKDSRAYRPYSSCCGQLINQKVLQRQQVPPIAPQ